MTDVILYGIKNCDTVRKARKWLENAAIEHRFHDVREQELAAATIDQWLNALGTDKVVNKRSTTWKQLSEQERSKALESKSATAILLQHPTLIKRPVLSLAGQMHVGFSDSHYQDIFKR